MTEDGMTGGRPHRPTATPAHRAPSGAFASGGASPGARLHAALSAQDVRRLTLFKWRYSLESAGFSSRQAAHLLFLKWLYARRGSARPSIG
jgi:hypothetical protein